MFIIRAIHWIMRLLSSVMCPTKYQCLDDVVNLIRFCSFVERSAVITRHQILVQSSSLLVSCLCLLGELGILGLGHHLSSWLFRNSNLSNPRLALRVLVDVARLALEIRVDLSHSTRDGCQDVRGGLDRLDGANCVALADFEINLRQLDVDDIAEGFSGVFGDAKGA
jgi:hypothetical protein